MKQVVVHPEHCLGCMQCMTACAIAHSQTQALFTAVMEDPVPKSRVHVGAGLFGEGFPNRCRHCDPAPCMAACLPGAISRIAQTNTVHIDPDKCINCASCAMVCPFGVIRYHEDISALPGKIIAVKCDNCHERQVKGQIPACVRACKSKALTFEEISAAMKRKTNETARSVSSEMLSSKTGQVPLSPGFELHNAVKKTQIEIKNC